MKLRATLLLIGEPAEVLGDLSGGLDERDGIHLIVVSDPSEGLSVLHRSSPDLVVGGIADDPEGFLDFCRNARDVAESREFRFAMVIEPGDSHSKAAAIRLGVQEFMTRPVEPDELIGKLRKILEMKRLKFLAGEMRTELESLRRTDRQRANGLVMALGSLIDMRIPGAARRGSRAAEICGRLAMRFGIPEHYRHGLDVAARLREIGRLSAPETCSGWQYVLASKAILRDMDGFDEAAELVGDILENWDGSGFPGHLISGQIPLRSRILRAVIDLVDWIDREPEAGWEKVIQGMSGRCGTLYDPMVIVHLKALIEDAPDLGVPDHDIRVQISGLVEGMILAEDLVTDSGVKLLSRGTVVTEPALQAILNRHASDPVLRGVIIRRKAAA
jgi:response regulator RpfG family c-di-GMP phosphodiesterase